MTASPPPASSDPSRLHGLPYRLEVTDELTEAGAPDQPKIITSVRPMKATIIRDNRGITLVTPFNAAFVASLVGLVPGSLRFYDPSTRTWWISNLHANEAIALAKTFFVVTVTDDRVRSYAVGWAAPLFAALPSRLHDQIYRALVKVLHPDVGGDEPAMKALTRAYTERPTR